jgi:hypothetical protein
VAGELPAANDFIEPCVNGRDNISVTVELPIRTGRGIFKTDFRHERTARSLGEMEEWVHRYFTLSHEDLGVALSGSGAV